MTTAQTVQTALVFGTAGTIGLACYKVFVARGWHVVLADDDSAALDTAREQLGEEPLIHAEGLGTRLGLRGVLAEAGERFSHLDTLIHIPPTVERKTISDTYRNGPDPVESARRAGAIINAFMPWMEQTAQMHASVRTNRPGFVHIFGMSAQFGDSGGFSQCASDSMALALVRAAATDLAEMKLRCNAVVALRPSATSQEAWLEERTPLGRACRASEIAEAAAFLAGAGAANMTGQTIVLDGGRSMLGGVIDTKVQPASG